MEVVKRMFPWSGLRIFYAVRSDSIEIYVFLRRYDWNYRYKMDWEKGRLIVRPWA